MLNIPRARGLGNGLHIHNVRRECAAERELKCGTVLAKVQEHVEMECFFAHPWHDSEMRMQALANLGVRSRRNGKKTSSVRGKSAVEPNFPAVLLLAHSPAR